MFTPAFLALSLAASPQCVDPPSLFRVGPAQAQTTIQGGLNLAANFALANPGVVPKVLVDPGSYSGPITFPPGVDIILQGDRFNPCAQLISGASGIVSTITLSGGQTTATVIEGFEIRGSPDGAFYGGVINLVSASATIEWNVLSDGFVAQSGGAIYAANSSAEIRRNVFHTNFANGDGGGIALYNSTAVVEHNQFLAEAGTCLEWSGAWANIADYIGGAIASVEGDMSTIHANTIAQNRARSGGGIGVLDSSPTITANRIFENGIWDAIDYGGGIYLENSSACVASNVIAFNGRIGGEDCAAPLEGGGVYVRGGAPQLVNNTIYGNLTIGNPWSPVGNASYGGGVAMVASSAVLINNLVWNNTADINPQIGGGSDLLQSSNCVEGGGGPFDLLCTDPGLIDPAGFDFHLTYTSALRDAGESVAGACAKSSDFEGDERAGSFEQGAGAPDVGADEYGSHVYFIGDMITPTSSGGKIRIIDGPGRLTGLCYAALLLSPGYQIPVGPFGAAWLLGANGPIECDFDPLIVQMPVFFLYGDAGGAYKTTNAQGYSEWTTPALTSPLPCVLTLYLQGLIQLPGGSLHATDAEALSLQ